MLIKVLERRNALRLENIVTESLVFGFTLGVLLKGNFSNVS